MTPPSVPGASWLRRRMLANVPAHHHLVVAPTRAVGVEVLRLDAVFDQVLAGGAVALDRARRRDVVGGDAVAEHGQHACALDVGHRLRLGGQALEERRPAHVGRVLVPGEAVAGRAPPASSSARRRRTPRRSSCGTCPTGPRPRSSAATSAALGQMSFRNTGWPSLVLAERVVVEVDVHRAGERVGDAQGGRGQVVHLHVGVDPALEVAVAREDRDDGEVLGVNDVRDLVGQRPAVADAGRAAVADEVKAELVEVLGQPGAVEVLGHDLGARGQRGLDPRLDLQAPLDRVARQDARRRASPTGSRCSCSS